MYNHFFNVCNDLSGVIIIGHETSLASVKV